MFVSFPCRCSGGVLGCYPLLLQLLLRVPPQCSGIKPSACWSSPGCFQNHRSATMKSFKAAILSLCCSCCCAHCFDCAVGLSPGSRPVDPRCCHEHPVTCWNCTRMCVGQCCLLTYIYIDSIGDSSPNLLQLLLRKLLYHALHTTLPPPLAATNANT